jgi:hypothetical protein
MAESADNPRTGSTEFTPAQPAGPPPLRESVRGFVPPPPSLSPEAYQPLSMMAVAGFALAVLYTVYIVGFALVTSFTGDHFYLAPSTVVLPVVVVIVCWVGRRMVLSSEGALGGARLANWGIGMSVVVGLCYWSYHAATVIALRQQAVAFTESKFLRDLSKGDDSGVEEAFLLTYNPPRPTSGIRKLIATSLDARSSLKVPGPYTTFNRMEYVRLLRMAGDKAKWQLELTSTPVLEKGEMRVVLVYKVDTPIKTFRLRILTAAVPPTKEAPGRQWRIERDVNQTGIPLDGSFYTPEGSRLYQTIEPVASSFLLKWLSKVSDVIDAPGAYLDTLPPARRNSLESKVRSKSPNEVKKIMATDPEVAEFFAGLAAFRSGSLIRAKKEDFMVADALREDVINEAKRMFLLNTPSGNNWIQFATLPRYEEDGKTIRFIYDADLLLVPKYIGGARFTVEADAEACHDPAAWRLVSMDLERAQAAPQGSGPPK